MAYGFARYKDPALQIERMDEAVIRKEQKKAPIGCDGCKNVERLFDKSFCAKGNKMERCRMYQFSGSNE